jgi:hypothetical protein
MFEPGKDVTFTDVLSGRYSAKEFTLLADVGVTSIEKPDKRDAISCLLAPIHSPS